MGADMGTQSGTCMPEVFEDVFDDQFMHKVAASASNTVVLLDWDDTLLCSTAVRIDQWGVDQLQDLEIAIEAILRTAMSLGETIIVTNGGATWVQDSARRFLPGVVPILSQIRVVSARALYEDRYPGDPFMWKHAAFEHLLTKERHFSAGVNLVAVGDQFPEIDAAWRVAELIGGSSLVKTVKLQEAPSVPELIGQLSRIEQILSRIVEEARSQSYGLVPRDLPPFFGHLTSTAFSWQCLTEAECALGRGDPMGIKEALACLTGSN